MASAMLSLLAAGLFLSSSAAAAAQCSKYTVQTKDNTYQFNHYKFLDFRNRDDGFLSSEEFNSAYRVQTWVDPVQNLASNVKIGRDTVGGKQVSMLSLYARHDGSQVTAAEVASFDKDYFYASVRMGVRVTGATGACAGLFFYKSDIQETDIEILTREQFDHKDAETMQLSSATTSQIHLTNQPKLTKTVDLTPNTLLGSNTQSKAAVRPASWTEFNDYRIDWIPGQTDWYQNGQLAHTAVKNLITTEASWIFNIWSNGDPSWSGPMAPGTEARLDILWVEMAYNKLSDGAPQIGTEGCALGVGNGIDLNNPGSNPGSNTTVSPASTGADRGDTNAPAASPYTPPTTVASGYKQQTTTVAKRASKFVA